MKKWAVLFLCCMLFVALSSCNKAPTEGAISSGVDQVPEEARPLTSEISIADPEDSTESSSLPTLTRQEIFQTIEGSFYLPNEEVSADMTNNLFSTVKTVFKISSEDKVDDYIMPASLRFYFVYTLSPWVMEDYRQSDLIYTDFINALKNGAHIKDYLAPYPDELHAYFEAEEGVLSIDPDQDFYSGTDRPIAGQPNRIRMRLRLYTGDGRFHPAGINMGWEAYPFILTQPLKQQLLASDLVLEKTTVMSIGLPGHLDIKLFYDREHEYILPGKDNVQGLQYLENDVLYRSSEFAKELEWSVEHPFTGGGI